MGEASLDLTPIAHQQPYKFSIRNSHNPLMHINIFWPERLYPFPPEITYSFIADI
jgi:hypothetical protein